MKNFLKILSAAFLGVGIFGGLAAYSPGWGTNSSGSITNFAPAFDSKFTNGATKGLVIARTFLSTGGAGVATITLQVVSSGVTNGIESYLAAGVDADMKSEVSSRLNPGDIFWVENTSDPNANNSFSVQWSND
jgi:hypothetical protein